ncbi:sulfurtransferase TusA family protein [Prosthecomicrobium sp. N25]|uniref:sulfurtransferase TusA family protein n=1 Tax=Prosthecomicrobium sp. N25 TaxID=3129254 RepID=UPI003076D7A1
MADGPRDDADVVRLDLKGLNCPLPVLKTRRRLDGMAPGTRVLVEATDPMSAIDIPHMVAEDGHRLVETRRAERVLTFLIERGAGAQPKRPEKPET